MTLPEASMLAGIPKGPSNYSPLDNFEKAKSRQRVVLQAMKNKNYISEQNIAEALRTSLALKGEHGTVTNKTAPYFQDAVKQALKSQLHLDDRMIELGGLKVYTTLDETQQDAAEKFSPISYPSLQDPSLDSGDGSGHRGGPCTGRR